MATIKISNQKATLVGLCLFGMMSFGAATANAQTTKEIFKERQELVKQSKSALNERASKYARKEAKTLQKEGWLVAPGALPLEKQLDRSYQMQMEYDADMYPKYIFGDAMSAGENYDAAKMQTVELAKVNLVEQIQTEITALIDNSLANQQLPAEEAASITKTVMEGKSLISQSVGRTLTIVECYRTLKNKNKEVRIRIAYNGDMAKAAAKNAVRQSLEKEGKDLQAELDKVFGTK